MKQLTHNETAAYRGSLASVEPIYTVSLKALPPNKYETLHDYILDSFILKMFVKS